MADLLQPRIVELVEVFENRFQGLTERPVLLRELEQARTDLLQTILRMMTATDKAFLLNIKRRESDWSLINFTGIDKLPAVRWKLRILHAITEVQEQVCDPVS